MKASNSKKFEVPEVVIVHEQDIYLRGKKLQFQRPYAYIQQLVQKYKSDGVFSFKKIWEDFRPPAFQKQREMLAAAVFGVALEVNHIDSDYGLAISDGETPDIYLVLTNKAADVEGRRDLQLGSIPMRIRGQSIDSIAAHVRRKISKPHQLNEGNVTLLTESQILLDFPSRKQLYRLLLPDITYSRQYNEFWFLHYGANTSDGNDLLVIADHVSKNGELYSIPIPFFASLRILEVKYKQRDLKAK